MVIKRKVSVYHVIISNIVSNGAERTCSISDIPEHSIKNVNLKNIKLEQTKIDVPENIGKYPEATMFGDLHAYGFYCRHVEGSILDDISLFTDRTDLRNAIYCDDVQNLCIYQLNTPANTSGESILYMRQVRDAVVSGCSPKAVTCTFLKASGESCRDITLSNNIFRNRKDIFFLEKGANENAVQSEFNF